MLLINMLQAENEYETPIESNYHQQKNQSFKNFDKSDNKQYITYYTEQERKGSSSTNNMYQKTAKKITTTF